MFSKLPLQNRFLSQHVAVQFAYAFAFNCAIAVLLTVIIKDNHFWQTLLVSQCIGLTIVFSFYLFSHVIDLHGWRMAIPLTVGSICGVILGIFAVVLVNNGKLSDAVKLVFNNVEFFWGNLFLAFFFGSIVLYFFLSRERDFQANHALKEIQIKNLDHKKQIAETHLQLLQAQIEPHFLFNSLSNVISLIENDPARAKLMLESLTHYLRNSLTRSHEKDGTLRDELDLIENYLKIIQIRMDDRLQYKIDVSDALWDRPFPIMILQPLVENAILHGLEPIAEGGIISVEADARDNMLVISVKDNGIGLKNDDLKGFGLMNVRQRLHSLFGDAGKLKLENNLPQGVCASVEMPYV